MNAQVTGEQNDGRTHGIDVISIHQSTQLTDSGYAAVVLQNSRATTSTLSRTPGAARPPALGPDVPAAVEAALHGFLDAESAELLSLDPALEPLVTAVRNSVLSGGKRLRPLFAYWAWRACGGNGDLAPTLPAFAALELLHAFALVHDDVMDRSATRRGTPTAHRALAATHTAFGMRGDADRFGESAAILAGDLCLVWADRLLGRTQVPPDSLAAARDAYDSMRIEAIAGQFLDVLGGCAPDWSVDAALRTARLKTAGYTVIRPLRFGAALAGARGRLAPPRLAFTRYGVATGEAFQLRDDLLGVFGAPEATGKPVGDDLVQGKPTVLLLLARAAATPRQATELDRLLARCADRGERGAPPEDQAGDITRLTELIEATGAPERVEGMIETRVKQAQAALTTTAFEPPAPQVLAGLARTLAWRSR